MHSPRSLSSPLLPDAEMCESFPPWLPFIHDLNKSAIESVAALGVAAAAVQFFGVIVKATALRREIRDNAESATDHNRDLEASVRELQDVQAQLAHAAQSSKPITRRRITDCLTKCYTDSDELRRLLEEVRGAGRNRSTLKNVCRAMKDRRRIEKLERSLLSKRDILQSVLQQETLQLSETQDTKLQEILQGLSQINAATGEALKTTTIHITTRLNQTDSNMRTLFTQSERTASSRHNQAMSEAQRRREESEAKAKADNFLQTLFFPEILERQSQIKGAAPGTLEWIFETEDVDVSDQMDAIDTDVDTSSSDDETSTDQEYSSESESSLEDATERTWDDLAAWLRNDNGVYWVNGKAGSGKSTLMAHILDDTRTKKALDVWCVGSNCHVLSYFFWRAGTGMQKSIVGLLRSLLYQICAGKPHRTLTIMNRLAIGTSMMHTWTEKLLKRAFHEAIDIAIGSRFCVFVDGLDEFDGNYAELVDLIFELQGHERVKFCVSSRPEVQLSKRLSSCWTVRLQDLNLSDIAHFTKLRLSEVRLSIDTGYKLSHDYIARRADGVFLWAALVTESLVRGFEAGDDGEILSKRLETVPQGLNDLFKSMLSKVEVVHRDSLAFYLHALSFDFRSDHILSIANLTASKAPSTLSSLASFEIACKRTESQIMAQSAGLIEIGESSLHEDFCESSWDPSDVWLKAGSSTLPVTRRRQTHSVEYPATLMYEAKPIRWIHRSAYDFVWNQDNAIVLNLSHTAPEDVLGKLYKGCLSLIICSPSCLPFNKIQTMTEIRTMLLLRSMETNWDSYDLITREAIKDLRLSFGSMDYSEIGSMDGGKLLRFVWRYRRPKNFPPDWNFWSLCIDHGPREYISESLDILPLSMYGAAIQADKDASSYTLKLIRRLRNTIVNLLEMSRHKYQIRLLWTTFGSMPSISYKLFPNQINPATSLLTEKYLAAHIARTLFECSYYTSPTIMDYWHEIINKSGLFIEVANRRPHLYMQVFASGFLQEPERSSSYFAFTPNAFRIVCFPSGNSSPFPYELALETGRFVYFDTTPDTTKHISQHLRRYNDPVSSSPDSDVEDESAVSDDYESQTATQEAQLSDENRSDRVVDEEDSSDWFTDDDDSTASSEEVV
ncbi:hypothetical protein PG991_015267 [Apiospora marii]|uniref:NACHT domain-containing protein n=1 Tax=Apiospora marii TaxID=335849 RepID=A0ABR1R180_9PEZI